MDCGVLGISAEEYLYNDLVHGLHQIQHRGQDAAGAVSGGKDSFYHAKGKGLVNDILTPRKELPGRMAIAHVRYPTFGSAVDEQDSNDAAQPLYIEVPVGVAMAHNGQITNTGELCERLKRYGDNCNGMIDVEYGLRFFARELERVSGGSVIEPGHIRDAVGSFMDTVRGAYAVVALIRKQQDYYLIAFADEHKIMPLSWAEKGGSIMFSSESVSYDTTGYTMVRDVNGGELVIVDGGKLDTVQVKTSEPRHCMFQYVYFARPASVLEGQSVHGFRKKLARRIVSRILEGVVPDTVVGVPNTGRGGYDEGVAEAMQDVASVSIANHIRSRLPLLRSLTGSELEHAIGRIEDIVREEMRRSIPRAGEDRNTYTSRSFITPAEKRVGVLNQKLIPVRSVMEGKELLLFDDSLVRCVTSRRTIANARNLGKAKKIHFVTAVKVVNPCVFGIDMTSKNQFPGRGKSNEQLSNEIGADSYTHGTVDDVDAVISLPPGHALCTGCLENGTYAFDISDIIARGGERPYEPRKNT